MTQETTSSTNDVGPALHLTERTRLLRGEKYQGVYQGREVDIYYHYASRFNLIPARLEISVSGNLNTRLLVFADLKFASVVNVPHTLLSPVRDQPNLVLPGYEKMQVRALDAEWSRQLLTDPEVQAVVLRWVGPEGPGLSTLVINPESLALHMFDAAAKQFNPTTMQQWVADLGQIARVAEQLPRPTQTSQTFGWERTVRSVQRKSDAIEMGLVTLVFGSLLLFALVMLACLLVPILLFLLLLLLRSFFV